MTQLSGMLQSQNEQNILNIKPKGMEYSVQTIDQTNCLSKIRMKYTKICYKCCNNAKQYQPAPQLKERGYFYPKKVIQK